MSQGYHQEWIGRDGSLNDKLLLNFSNLNTGVVWFDHSLFWKHFPWKSLKSCLLPGLGLIHSSQRASLEHLGGRVGSRSQPWSVWKCGKAGRGGLTGRWTSSSCRPGRSKSCHSPTAGLHPCRPAGPTISGCPEAYCTSLMIELLSPWGRCRFSHENLTSSQTSSSCCPKSFKLWCTNTWQTLKKYILSLPPHKKAASTESGIPGKPFSIGPG